jgi:hypothetical protein
MNRLYALAIPILFLPTVAQACPYADGCSTSCGSSFSYVFAFGGGLLAGILSIALERRTRG